MAANRAVLLKVMLKYLERLQIDRALPATVQYCGCDQESSCLGARTEMVSVRNDDEIGCRIVYSVPRRVPSHSVPLSPAERLSFEGRSSAPVVPR